MRNYVKAFSPCVRILLKKEVTGLGTFNISNVNSNIDSLIKHDHTRFIQVLLSPVQRHWRSWVQTTSRCLLAVAKYRWALDTSNQSVLLGVKILYRTYNESCLFSHLPDQSNQVALPICTETVIPVIDGITVSVPIWTGVQHKASSRQP